MTVRELLIRLGFDFNEAQAKMIESKISSIKSMSNTAAGAVGAVGQKIASTVAPGVEVASKSVSGFRENIAASMAASAGHVDTLKGHVSSLKNNLVGMVGLAAGGFGLFALANSAIMAGDNVYRLSTKLRLSAGDAAGLNRILSSVGVDANSFATTITRMDRQIESAGKKGNATSNALAQFGVNLKGADGQLLPVNKQLEALADGFQKAEEAGKSDEFVTNVLGPRGMELVPVLRDYKEAAEAASKVQGIGLDPKKAHEAAVSLRVLKMQTSQLGLTMANAFLPVAEKIMPKLIKLFQGIANFAGKYKALAQSIATISGAFIGIFAVAKAIAIIKEMYGTIKSVYKLVRAFLITNPELLLIVAAAIALALVLEDIYTWIQGGNSLMGDWLGSWDEFKAKAGTFFQPLIADFKKVWQFIQSYILPGLQQIWSTGVMYFNALSQGANTYIIPAFQEILDAGIQAFTAIASVVGPVISWIIEQWAELTNNGQLYLDLLLTAWNGFVNAILLLMQFIFQVFTLQWGAAIDTVIGFFENLLSTALSILSQIGAAIGQYVLSKLGAAGRMIGKLAGINLEGIVSPQDAGGAGGDGTTVNQNFEISQSFDGGTATEQADFVGGAAQDAYQQIGDNMDYGP